MSHYELETFEIMKLPDKVSMQHMAKKCKICIIEMF